MTTSIASQFPTFAADFTGSIPADLRPRAAAMPRGEFLATYGPTSGPIRLGSWAESPGRGGLRHFDATLAIGSRIQTFHLDAHGPIAALSSALYDAGHGVEILSFHQQTTADGTTTFMHCEQNGRRHWAVGTAADATDSALRALVAAANIFDGTAGQYRAG